MQAGNFAKEAWTEKQETLKYLCFFLQITHPGDV